MIEPKRLMEICNCGSIEHQLIMSYYSKDEQEEKTNLFVHFFLQERPFFWKRLKDGIKYIFGYKCRYGHFDEHLWDDDQVKEVIEFLKQYLDDGKEKN